MLAINWRLLLGIFFLGVTMICSINGDNDAVYRYWNRKPTPQESFAWVRFVLSKYIASIYCGAFTGVWFVRNIYLAFIARSITNNQAVLIFALAMFFVYCAIGVAENAIRLIQKRPTRPLVDMAVYRRGIRGWTGRR